MKIWEKKKFHFFFCLYSKHFIVFFFFLWGKLYILVGLKFAFTNDIPQIVLSINLQPPLLQKIKNTFRKFTTNVPVGVIYSEIPFIRGSINKESAIHYLPNTIKIKSFF